MPIYICPHCGGASFHEGLDGSRFINLHGKYDDGTNVQPDTKLYCSTCGNITTAEQAETIGKSCFGTTETDGLNFPSLEILTLLLSRLFHLVEMFETNAAVDLASEFDELTAIFGWPRIHTTLMAMYYLAYVGLPEMLSIPEEIQDISLYGTDKGKPLYKFIKTVMDRSATETQYKIYIAIANQWINQGRHHSAKHIIPAAEI